MNTDLLVFSIFLMFWIGVAVGWISHMSYEAETKKDEKIVDDTLDKAYQAG